MSVKEHCPSCGKPLDKEGALRADRQQPWEKTVRGRTRRGFKIVSLHYECATGNPRRFDRDVFAEPRS